MPPLRWTTVPPAKSRSAVPARTRPRHTHWATGGAAKKAATPAPMRDRHVDEEQPPSDEPQERGKTHAVRDRARDQGNRDDRKCHLINHVQEFRNGRRERARRLDADAAQEQA